MSERITDSLPIRSDHPAQFHLYRGRHLFWNDHYLGKVDVPDKEIVLFEEFMQFQGEIVEWVGRAKGVRLPVREVGGQSVEVKPLEEFPAELRLIMEGPVDPSKGAMSPSAGDEHPEAIIYAINNFSQAEFKRRYGGRFTLATAKKRFAKELKLDPKDYQDDPDLIESKGGGAPPPAANGEPRGYIAGPWDEEMDGPAPDTFVCADCREANPEDEAAATHPIADYAGRATHHDEMPICSACAGAYQDGGA